MFKGKIIRDKKGERYDPPEFKDEERIQEEVEKQEEIDFEAEIAEVKKDAYEKGYGEGFASGESSGFQSGEEKAMPILEELEALVNQFKSYIELREQTLNELEPQVVEMAITMARKVIIEEPKINPEVIVTIVKEALSRLENKGPVKIKVNPAIYELIMKAKPELSEISSELIFDTDSDSSPNGPLLEGPTQAVITDMDQLINNVLEDIGVGFGSN